jgi:hypothetical protein
MTRTLVGLDLGQARDFTALAVLTRPRPAAGAAKARPPYDVPHLMRFPLGTPYPDVVRQVVALLSLPAFRGSSLVVDQTGVGRAVVDILREALQGKAGCSFVGVTITAGHAVTRGERGELRVPKKELVGVLQALLSTQRLRVAKSLPEAAVLVKELGNFRVKITEAANETFGAWRSGQHDDLVLAVALAAWVGERCLGGEGPAGAPRVLGGA